jgi:uncharacterized coiled-coil DUF342 family protein
MVTADELKEKIAALVQERDALRAQWAEAFKKAESSVNDILKEAGLFDRVEVIRSELTALQNHLQPQADVITRQIEDYQKSLKESAE